MALLDADRVKVDRQAGLSRVVVWVRPPNQFKLAHTELPKAPVLTRGVGQGQQGQKGTHNGPSQSSGHFSHSMASPLHSQQHFPSCLSPSQHNRNATWARGKGRRCWNTRRGRHQRNERAIDYHTVKKRESDQAGR